MCIKMLGEAQRLGHPHTSIIASFIAAMICQFRQDKGGVKSQAIKMRELCLLHGVRLWKIAAEILFMWADSSKKSIHQLELSILNWKDTGAVLFMPYWQGLLADRLFESGNFNKSLSIAEQAINFTESWWQAELWRIKAFCLYRKGEKESSVEAFLNGLRIARAQTAIKIEKRIVENMCDLGIDN